MSRPSINLGIRVRNQTVESKVCLFIVSSYIFCWNNTNKYTLRMHVPNTVDVHMSPTSILKLVIPRQQLFYHSIT